MNEIKNPQSTSESPGGCITSLLIAFQDFLVSGVSVQVSGLAIPDT